MQRKCGSCRYFEEGGIASSGWCRHPDRQDLEHMVLVRKTELACRQGWDHDLWEPRDQASHSANSNGANVKLRNSERLSARQRKQPAPSAPMEPDSDTILDLNGSPVVDQEPEVNHSRTAIVEDPFVGDTRGRDAWSSGLRTEHTGHDSGIDQLQAETVSARPPSPNGDWQGHLERYRGGSRSEIEPVPAPPVFDRSLAPDDARGVAHEGSIEVEPVRDEDWRHSEPVQQSGLTEQFDVQEPGVAELTASTESPDAGEQDVTASEADEMDDATGSLKLPMLQIGSACCRNCRDFIPGKDGARGWCSNPFAFEARQEVRGDTIACRSSVGSWWSPSDDWWMERADIAHHSAPTPLVNNLIRQRRSRQFEEEGSTQGHARS